MISVLLPFRDAEATLEDAARSVLAERDVPIELVAVDDGSRDDGAARLRALCDPRVRLVSTEGVGIARALATALSLARFPLVARMDADDVSLPGRFAAQLRALDGRVAVVGTQVEAIGSAGEGMHRYVAWLNGIVRPEDHAREIFVESPLCHPSVLMRRSAIEAVGGYRESDGPEDYDLWLRLDAAGHRFAKVPEVLLRWRHHDARATLRDPRMTLDRLRTTKAPFLAARLARMARPVTVWGAGKTGRRLARALEPHGIAVESFVDIDPRKIGGVARGAPIVAPSHLPRGHTVVVAVGEPGARDIVRARLVAMGLDEGRDFVCAA